MSYEISENNGESEKDGIGEDGEEEQERFECVEYVMEVFMVIVVRVEYHFVCVSNIHIYDNICIVFVRMSYRRFVYISRDTVFFRDPPVFRRDFLGIVFPCRSFSELMLIMESPSREI